jgi:hypothetical protein
MIGTSLYTLNVDTIALIVDYLSLEDLTNLTQCMEYSISYKRDSSIYNYILAKVVSLNSYDTYTLKELPRYEEFCKLMIQNQMFQTSFDKSDMESGMPRKCDKCYTFITVYNDKTIIPIIKFLDTLSIEWDSSSHTVDIVTIIEKCKPTSSLAEIQGLLRRRLDVFELKHISDKFRDYSTNNSMDKGRTLIQYWLWDNNASASIDGVIDRNYGKYPGYLGGTIAYKDKLLDVNIFFSLDEVTLLSDFTNNTQDEERYVISNPLISCTIQSITKNKCKDYKEFKDIRLSTDSVNKLYIYPLKVLELRTSEYRKNPEKNRMNYIATITASTYCEHCMPTSECSKESISNNECRWSIEEKKCLRYFASWLKRFTSTSI